MTYLVKGAVHMALGGENHEFLFVEGFDLFLVRFLVLAARI